MRWRQVVIVTGMLLRFFARQVLRAGPLRSVAARVTVVVVVVTGCGLLADAVKVVFERPDGAWSPLADMLTLMVVLFGLTAFMLVRLAFANASGLLDLTVHLPLTGRERSGGILAAEAVLTTGVALPLNGTLAVVAWVGSGAGVMLVVVVLPAVLTYLVATVVFELVGRLASHVGLARAGDYAALVAGSLGLWTYAASIVPAFAALSTADTDGTDLLLWQTALAWVSRRVGLAPPLAGGVLAVLVLVVVALWLARPRRPAAARYLPVLRGAARRGWVGPYDLALLRSTETALSVFFATVAFALLWATRATNPLWSLAILAMPALHHYPAAQHLHGNGPTVPAAVAFVRLTRAPLLLLGAFAAVEAPLVVLTGTAVPQLLAPLAAGLSAVVVVACLGIVFPAKSDIPASAQAALLPVSGLLALIAAATSRGYLPMPVGITATAALQGALVAWAIHQIKAHEATSRYEGAAQADRRTHGLWRERWRAATTARACSQGVPGAGQHVVPGAGRRGPDARGAQSARHQGTSTAGSVLISPVTRTRDRERA